MFLSDGIGGNMANQKLSGFKISEISEMARIEFKMNEKTTRNHLGKPDKTIKQSVLRQLKEHKKFLKNT